MSALKSVACNVLVEIKINKNNNIFCGSGSDMKGSHQCPGLTSKYGNPACRIFTVTKVDTKGREKLPVFRLLRFAENNTSSRVLRCQECLNAERKTFC